MGVTDCEGSFRAGQDQPLLLAERSHAPAVGSQWHRDRSASDSAIRFFIESSLSENTIRAYQSDLKAFRAWGGRIPSSAEEVARYLAVHAAVLSPYTLTRRLSAIRRAHRALDLNDPGATALVKGVLRGVWRRRGRAQTGARPLLLDELEQLLPWMIGKKGHRDRALTLLGFRAALRRSELVALDVEDLAFSGEGVLVRIRRSKTDQEGCGRTIAVPYCKAACAVTALLDWLDVANVEVGPVFQSLDPVGNPKGRLTAQSVSLILRAYARAAGVEASHLSAHSLRAGFVTTAAKAGTAVHAIQRQTGHRSIETLYRYVRTTNPFVGNANTDLEIR